MSTRAVRPQYAALPLRMAEGRLEVLLITSRDTGRWILPKGQPEKELRPHEVAAREAYEEAGLIGVVDERPFGSYSAVKRTKSGRMVPCRVEAYILRVERELDDWPEREQRTKRWIDPAAAAALVAEEELAGLLRELSALHAANPRAWDAAPMRAHIPSASDET